MNFSIHIYFDLTHNNDVLKIKGTRYGKTSPMDSWRWTVEGEVLRFPTTLYCSYS